MTKSREINMPRCRASDQADDNGRPLCTLHSRPMWRQGSGWRCALNARGAARLDRHERAADLRRDRAAERAYDELITAQVEDLKARGGSPIGKKHWP